MKSTSAIMSRDMTAQQLKDFANTHVGEALLLDDNFVYSDPLINKYLNIVKNLQTLKKSVFNRSSTTKEKFEPATMEALISWYEDTLIEMDRVIDDAEKTLNVRCCCKKKCSSCCRGTLITVTRAEAEVIHSFVNSDTFDQNTKRKIYKRIKGQSALIIKSGFSIESIMEADAKGEIDPVKNSYHRLYLTCPFLIDDECAIHSVRPLDCWGFREYVSNYFCEKVPVVLGTINYCDESNNDYLYTLRHLMSLVFADENGHVEMPIIGPLQVVMKNVLDKYES